MDAEDLAGAVYRPPEEGEIRCEHGYHHSSSPHSCDRADHDGGCPFREAEGRER